MGRKIYYKLKVYTWILFSSFYQRLINLHFEMSKRRRNSEGRIQKGCTFGFCSLLFISVYQRLINLLFESVREGGRKIKKAASGEAAFCFYSKHDIIYR